MTDMDNPYIFNMVIEYSAQPPHLVEGGLVGKFEFI